MVAWTSFRTSILTRFCTKMLKAWIRSISTCLELAWMAMALGQNDHWPCSNFPALSAYLWRSSGLSGHITTSACGLFIVHAKRVQVSMIRKSATRLLSQKIPILHIHSTSFALLEYGTGSCISCFYVYGWILLWNVPNTCSCSLPRGALSNKATGGIRSWGIFSTTFFCLLLSRLRTRTRRDPVYLSWRCEWGWLGGVGDAGERGPDCN
jgi:hypothetical protein